MEPKMKKAKTKATESMLKMLSQSVPKTDRGDSAREAFEDNGRTNERRRQASQETW
jgi:hypothetical protein